MLSQIANHQIHAIRASLVAAMEQIDGLLMVIEAQQLEAAPTSPPPQEPVTAREEVTSRPTFGRAKASAAQTGDQ